MISLPFEQLSLLIYMSMSFLFSSLTYNYIKLHEASVSRNILTLTYFLYVTNIPFQAITILIYTFRSTVMTCPNLERLLTNCIQKLADGVSPGQHLLMNEHVLIVTLQKMNFILFKTVSYLQISEIDIFQYCIETILVCIHL